MLEYAVISGIGMAVYGAVRYIKAQKESGETFDLPKYGISIGAAVVVGAVFALLNLPMDENVILQALEFVGIMTLGTSGVKATGIKI